VWFKPNALREDGNGWLSGVGDDLVGKAWEGMREGKMVAKIPQIRMRLMPRAETIVRRGHPWVFDESIREANREGETGELVVIYDRHDKFLAVGLLDIDSPIRVRILHRGKPQRIDGEWFRLRMEEALALRDGVADEKTTGLRLINGENDGLPGLVLDRYEGVLVLKLYTST